MKILIGVDSLFQFIIATNLRTTVYKEDDVDIIIYNSTGGAERIYDNLKNKNIYNNVFLATTSLTYCGGSYSKIKKLPKYFVYLQTLINPSKALTKILGNSIQSKYDYFLFNGYGALPDCIFNTCYKLNPNIRCLRIEDGLASYFEEYSKVKGLFRKKFEKFFYSIFQGENIEKYIDGYYFSMPELVMVNLPYKILQGPKISRSNTALVTLLNEIFDYKAEYGDEFKHKVIMFEDGYLFFNGREDEIDLAKMITEMIPPDKFIVKCHPRRKVDRYKGFGVTTSKSSAIPWELIQLNTDLSGSTMITFGSSSVFSADVYFDDNCEKILLYKCIKDSENIYSEKYRNMLEHYIAITKNDSLKLLESYDEFRKLLTEVSIKSNNR